MDKPRLTLVGVASFMSSSCEGEPILPRCAARAGRTNKDRRRHLDAAPRRQGETAC